MDTNKQNCLKCQKQMTERNVTKPGFFNGKGSTVFAFVCTNCGYVELEADNVEIFKEDL